MVIHWFKLKSSGWRQRALMNGVGAILTAVVSVVIVLVKFVHGAFLVVVAVPILVGIFYAVRRHYDRVAAVLEPQNMMELEELGRVALSRPRTTVVLFVAQVNSLTARSLSLARALAPDDVHAVTVSSDPERLARLQDTWARMNIDLPLEVVESPFREFIKPAVAYVRSLKPGPDHTVTVVIPEFVVEHWYETLLHNQDALRLKGALYVVPWVVVINIPLHISEARTGETPD